MSGQTAAWRRRYSTRRSGFTCKVKQTRRTPRTVLSQAEDPQQTLEIELVHVGRVERERLTEQYHAALAHGVLAELAGLELVARLAGDDARCERAADVRRQVAEVGRVPQRERL